MSAEHNYVVVMETPSGRVKYYGPFTTAAGADAWGIANSGEELDFIHVLVLLKPVD